MSESTNRDIHKSEYDNRVVSAPIGRKRDENTITQAEEAERLRQHHEARGRVISARSTKV